MKRRKYATSSLVYGNPNRKIHGRQIAAKILWSLQKHYHRVPPTIETFFLVPAKNDTSTGTWRLERSCLLSTSHISILKVSTPQNWGSFFTTRLRIYGVSERNWEFDIITLNLLSPWSCSILKVEFPTITYFHVIISRAGVGYLRYPDKTNESVLFAWSSRTVFR